MFISGIIIASSLPPSAEEMKPHRRLSLPSCYMMALCTSLSVESKLTFLSLLWTSILYLKYILVGKSTQQKHLSKCESSSNLHRSAVRGITLQHRWGQQTVVEDDGTDISYHRGSEMSKNQLRSVLQFPPFDHSNSKSVGITVLSCMSNTELSSSSAPVSNIISTEPVIHIN